jgi:opacity protein-like surface antigen
MLPMKALLLAALLATLAPSALAQTTTVTDQTLTLSTKTVTPPRRAILHYPQLSGLTDPEVLKKVQMAIDLPAVLDEPLEAIKQNYNQYYWLTGVNYQVNYNQNGIFDVTYEISGLGAYPSTSEKQISVSLISGKVLRAEDLFKVESLGVLARLLDQALQAEIKAGIAKVKAAEPDLDAEQMFRNRRYRVHHLNNFSITPQGVTFRYDYGFPHVALAYEPAGRFALTYGELQPYLKPTGVLGFAIAPK